MYSTNHVRGEHLLWLTPILYIWLTSINAPISNFIVLIDGSFYLFNFFSSLMILLIILALPYYMHRHLREKELRSAVISWIHIVPTLLLILSIITIYSYAPSINRSWKDSTLTNPNFSRWELYNDVAITLFEVLILIQVAYLFYGLVVININKLEQSDIDSSEYESYSFDDNQVMINPAYKYTWIPKPAEPFN